MSEINLMPIDDEIQMLITFLSHPGGFDVDMSGILCIRPVDEGCPPTNWAVDWWEEDNGVRLELEKCFPSLEEAARFFVEKRRYLCLGLDFEAILMGNHSEKVEVIDE